MKALAASLVLLLAGCAATPPPPITVVTAPPLPRPVKPKECVANQRAKFPVIAKQAGDRTPFANFDRAWNQAILADAANAQRAALCETFIDGYLAAGPQS